MIHYSTASFIYDNLRHGSSFVCNGIDMNILATDVVQIFVVIHGQIKWKQPE